jgi:hypothetical protein
MAYRAFDIGLPFEATGRTPRNPNNPIAINNEIRNQVHSDAYQQRGAEKYISPYIEGQDKRFLTANYDQQYLGYLLGNPTQGQQTQPTPLTGNDLKKWQSERDRLLGLLFIKNKSKTDCLKFLEAKLKKIGFDVNKLIQDLTNQVPYDFEKSTNADVTSIFNNTKDFADYLKKTKQPLPDAYTSPNTRNIYYTSTGLKLSIILHESLHRLLSDPSNLSLPLLDQTLADEIGAIKKGVKVFDAKKNPKGSKIISEKLEAAGCK